MEKAGAPRIVRLRAIDGRYGISLLHGDRKKKIHIDRDLGEGERGQRERKIERDGAYRGFGWSQSAGVSRRAESPGRFYPNFSPSWTFLRALTRRYFAPLSRGSNGRTLFRSTEKKSSISFEESTVHPKIYTSS